MMIPEEKEVDISQTQEEVVQEQKETRVSEYELKLRKENEKRRKENEQLQEQLRVLQEELNKYAQKEKEEELLKKDELERERLLRQELEAKLKDMEQNLQEAEKLGKWLAVTQKAKDFAFQVGFNDPEDAVYFLQDKIEKLDLKSDDFEEALKSEVKDLLQKKPYLRRISEQDRINFEKVVANPTNNPEDKAIPKPKSTDEEVQKLEKDLEEKIRVFDGPAALRTYLKLSDLRKKLNKMN